MSPSRKFAATIAEAVDLAESSAVAADRFEEKGAAKTARALSRQAAGYYEQAASQALASCCRRAVELYRLAEKAYRRGWSHGRALRMQHRAEKWSLEAEAVEARHVAWCAELDARLAVAS